MNNIKISIFKWRYLTFDVFVVKTCKDFCIFKPCVFAVTWLRSQED